jgi:tetratricopeptide (TPR) repeat protein
VRKDDTVIESKSIRQLYQNRGRVLELAIQYEAALANYQELADLSAKRDDQSGYLSAIIAQCVLHSTYNPVFDPQKGRELGETALDLAVKVKDREAEARALWCLMMVEFHARNQSEQVIEYGKKALFMAQELGAKELEGYVLGNLSWAHSLRLQLKESLKTNTQALEIWQSLGNLPMVADALSVRLGTLMFLGDHEDLLAAGIELERLSQELENALHHYMALLLMGEDHYLQGRLEQALLFLEKAAAVGNASGDDRLSLGHRWYQIPVYLIGGAFEQAERAADECYAAIEEVGPLFQNHLLAIIANAKIALGKRSEAQAVLEQALITLDRESSYSYDHWLLMVADGHLQLALGNPARALERMEVVIQKLQQVGGRYHLAESLWLQGKAYLVMEKDEQAREAFMQAKAMAEAGSERAILWQILATFSEFERVCGNQQEAEMLADQAQEIIAYIADHAGDMQDLRASFLAQPKVAKVLARPQVRIPNQ